MSFNRTTGAANQEVLYCAVPAHLAAEAGITLPYSNAATGTAAKFGLEAERIGDNISVTFVKEKRECQKSDYGQR